MWDQSRINHNDDSNQNSNQLRGQARDPRVMRMPFAPPATTLALYGAHEKFVPARTAQHATPTSPAPRAAATEARRRRGPRRGRGNVGADASAALTQRRRSVSTASDTAADHVGTLWSR
jgi:hypothetical protein